jgi:hypothetical protein
VVLDLGDLFFSFECTSFLLLVYFQLVRSTISACDFFSACEQELTASSFLSEISFFVSGFWFSMSVLIQFLISFYGC